MRFIRLLNRTFEHSAPRSAASRRGFTVIELMTVVAITTVLAGLSYSAVSDGVRRSNSTSAAIELSAIVQQAKQRMAFTGQDVFLLVTQADSTSPSTQSGDKADVCSETTTGIQCAKWELWDDTISTIAPVSPKLASWDTPSAAANDVKVASGYFPRGIRLGSEAGYTPPVLTGPFSLLPDVASKSLGGHQIAGCSVCGTFAMPAWVRFSPDGTVTFNHSSSANPGAVILLNAGRPHTTHGIGITPSGLVTSRLWK